IERRDQSACRLPHQGMFVDRVDVAFAHALQHLGEQACVSRRQWIRQLQWRSLQRCTLLRASRRRGFGARLQRRGEREAEHGAGTEYQPEFHQGFIARHAHAWEYYTACAVGGSSLRTTLSPEPCVTAAYSGNCSSTSLIGTGWPIA